MSIKEIIKITISPLEKLLDAVIRGTGILLEPYIRRRNADSIAYEIKTISDAIKSSNLNITFNNENLSIDNKLVKDITERTINRSLYQELTKQDNIEKISAMAYNELLDKKECSPEEISSTWLNKYFEYASHISDKELQVLWSKILAGEITNTNSISLRTLSVLSNLSKKEAETFLKATDIILYNGESTILLGDQFLNMAGIKYPDLIQLIDSGLIMPLETNIVTLKISNQYSKIFGDNEYVLMAKSDIVKSIEIPCYALTKTGIDLDNIINQNHVTDSKELYKQISVIINSKYKNIDFSIFKIIKNKDNDVDHDKLIKIDF